MKRYEWEPDRLDRFIRWCDNPSFSRFLVEWFLIMLLLVGLACLAWWMFSP